MVRVMTTILATGYVADGTDAEYWIEGEPVAVEVEDDGVGGVRVGVMIPETDQEVVGLYFTASSARDLIVGLGAAIKDLES